MTLVYLSHFLGEDTPFYGGDGRFLVERLRSMASGDPCNTSRWSFPNHCGTHIDLPRHFVDDGMCVSDYSPDFWVFNKVGVADIPGVQPGFVLCPESLDGCPVAQDTELLLLKTGFGSFRATSAYWQENPVFLPEIADYLRRRFPSLRAFGFDTISVSSWTDRATGRAAHQRFLGGERPILLIEDMNLAAIHAAATVCRVTVAPMLVAGADAAPCTVIAEVIN
jgi:arylformamidase